MTWNLGPRSLPVYAALRDRILAGDLAPGSRLPSHSALAAEFGVASMTLRQALEYLESEGLICREHGRGTFVRPRSAAEGGSAVRPRSAAETGSAVRPRSAAETQPAVLIVNDEAPLRALLAAHVSGAGYRAVEAADPDEGLATLERDPAIALVLSDVRMPPPGDVVGFMTRPDTAAGIGFIRTVRRRWPRLPLAAVTAYPDDLAELHGTAECPVLVIPKPFGAAQIQEVLRLALPSRASLPAGSPSPFVLRPSSVRGTV